MNKRELITELLPDEEFLFADGHDNAIIGVCYCQGRNLVAYDISKIIKNLVEGGMTQEEALEFYSFNIEGAHMGPMTPVYVEPLEVGDE